MPVGPLVDCKRFSEFNLLANKHISDPRLEKSFARLRLVEAGFLGDKPDSESTASR